MQLRAGATTDLSVAVNALKGGLHAYAGLFMSPGFRDNLLRPNPKRKRG
jgi:hypothetical protein